MGSKPLSGGVATVVMLLAMASHAVSAEPDVTLEGRIDHTVGIDDGESLYTSLELLPSYATALGKRTRLTASARVRLGSTNRLEPDGTIVDAYAPLSRPWVLGNTGSVEIRDLFLEHRVGEGRIRIGKQSINWGRLDGIKVLDVVNPQDFRAFIIDDFDQSRISLWSAYGDFTLGNWRSELALVADGTGHAIPDDNAWFSFRAPRFRFGSPADQQAAFSVTSKPGHGISDTAAGLRVSRQTARGEITFLVYRGRDPEPLGRFVTNDGGTGIERFFEPRTTLGTSFDLGLGNQVVRGEIAYHPDRRFNTRSGLELSTDRRSQVRAALGVDVSAPLGSLLNLQLLYDRVEGDRDFLVRPVRQRLLTLGLRKAIGFDRWVFQLRAYRSMDDEDHMLNVKVTRAFGENTSVEFQLAAFDGEANGLFGQFEARDVVSLRISQFF